MKPVSTWSMKYKVPDFRHMREGVDYIFTDAQDLDQIVDIPMLTYNHAKYIRQAVESVLNQKTRYKYRLIIADDCSTDGTTDIVREYQAKHPDRIATLIWTHNVGCKCNGVTTGRHETAEYVAPLEGEDYWTDDRKIEKAISFLEEHPEFAAFAHNLRIVDENGELKHGYETDYGVFPIREERVWPRESTKNFFLWKVLFPSQINAIVIRNFRRTWDDDRWELLAKCKEYDDIIQAVDLAHAGDIYISRDVMLSLRREYREDNCTGCNKRANANYERVIQRIQLDEYSKSAYGEGLGCVDRMLREFTAESTRDMIMDFTPENIKIFLQCHIAAFSQKHFRRGRIG